LAITGFALVLAASATSRTLELNADWHFHRGDQPGAEQPAFDDRDWRTVAVPHDWSIEDLPGQAHPFDRNAPGGASIAYTQGGVGWYRLKLELPRADGQPAETQSNALSVLVNADGRYFIGDREALRTDVESLKRTIAEVAGDDRDRSVLLRADARTPHQAVVTALDALGQLGFRRIAIATAPESKR